MLEPGSIWRKVAQMALGTGMLQIGTIITYIALARLLDTADYGTYRQLFLLNQITWGVLFSAFPATLLYFAGRSDRSEQTNRIIRQHLHLILGIGASIPLGFILSGPFLSAVLGNPALKSLTTEFALYPLAYVLIHLLAPVLIAKQRTDLLPLMTGGAALTTTCTILIAAWFTADLRVVVITATAANCLVACVCVLTILGLTRRQSEFGVETKAILRYGWPLLVATGISLVGLRLDHVAISNLFGPALYAIYAVGAFELPIYALVKTSSTSVFLPELSRHAQANDWPEMTAAWHDLLRKNAAIILPASAALFAFSTDFIVSLFGPHYRQAGTVFAVFTLLGPVRSISFNLILRAKGETRPDLIGAIMFTLVVAAAIVPVAQTFSFFGAAGLVVISTYAVAAFLIVVTSKATDGNLTLRQLYPPRLFAIFGMLLFGFSALRAFTTAFSIGPWISLLIGALAGLFASLAFLRNQRVLIPFASEDRNTRMKDIHGSPRHARRK